MAPRSKLADIGDADPLAGTLTPALLLFPFLACPVGTPPTSVAEDVMTPEAKLAASAREIHLIVESLEKLVSRCDPLQLLSAVYWDMYVRIMSHLRPRIIRKRTSSGYGR